MAIHTVAYDIHCTLFYVILMCYRPQCMEALPGILINYWSRKWYSLKPRMWECVFQLGFFFSIFFFSSFKFSIFFYLLIEEIFHIIFSSFTEFSTINATLTVLMVHFSLFTSKMNNDWSDLCRVSCWNKDS